MSPFPPRPLAGPLTEEEWARREAWMRELLDASNDGFWEWNVVTGYVRFSGRWAEMLGYKEGELEPHVRSWEKLLHPDDRALVMRVLQDHLEGRTPYYKTEHRLKRADGSWIWILDRGRVVERDVSGKAIRAAGAHVDITSEKMVQFEKEEISRGRKEVLELVSHELKNPIHTLLTSIAFFRRKSTLVPLPQNEVKIREEEVIDGMLRAVQRMDSLVNDLLFSTRIESGIPELHLSATALNSLIQEAREEVESRRALKELELKTSFGPGIEGAFIETEKVRMLQVLTNLLENSIKFTPPRGQVLISAEVLPDPPRVLISVEDSGPGIPEADRGKVFDRFWRGRTAPQPGSGLGLSIAQAIIKAHGGTIEVGASSLGGVRFLFSLPLVRASADAPEAA